MLLGHSVAALPARVATWLACPAAHYVVRRCSQLLRRVVKKVFCAGVCPFPAMLEAWRRPAGAMAK